jgi:hypothetical protein
LASLLTPAVGHGKIDLPRRAVGDKHAVSRARSRASQIANDRLTRWIGCVIAFALAFFVLFLTMPRYLNVYDESFMLTGALRVNAGELPYRDFYAIYGPAEYYALAGLFKLFGPSVLAERLFDLTVEALIVAAAFAIVYRYSDRWMAAFSALIAFLWLSAFKETWVPRRCQSAC